jgi:ribosomal protein L37AE/L43A
MGKRVPADLKCPHCKDDTQIEPGYIKAWFCAGCSKEFDPPAAPVLAKAS